MRVGMNSRMDTIKAAVLLQKLSIFPDEIAARNRVAARYAEGLGDVVRAPPVIDGGVSVWAQYTIETDDRDGLAAHLRAEEIPLGGLPGPAAPAGALRPLTRPGGLPGHRSGRGRVIQPAMHAYLQPDVQDRIVTAIRNFVKKNG